MTLSPGKLDPYEIVETIGTGGMGEVYRARDARLGRDVVNRAKGKNTRPMEKGIVHRDLKPENIFLTRDGHVKIFPCGQDYSRLRIACCAELRAWKRCRQFWKRFLEFPELRERSKR